MCSGISNLACVVQKEEKEEEEKEREKMQNYYVVQIIQHILAICFFRTTALFIKDHTVFLLESSLLGQTNLPNRAITQPCRAIEPPPAEASSFTVQYSTVRLC